MRYDLLQTSIALNIVILLHKYVCTKSERMYAFYTVKRVLSTIHSLSAISPIRLVNSSFYAKF